MSTYPVFTEELTNQIFEQSFAKAKTLVDHRSFKVAMTALDRALDSKSKEPMVKLSDQGYADPIVYFIDGFRQSVAEIVERNLRYDYSLHNLAFHKQDYRNQSGALDAVLDSLDTILTVYKVGCEIRDGRYDTPFMVQKQMMEKLSVLLQFPHRKSTTPEMLSFYRKDDLARNRVTQTKSGKWFLANELGIEKEALEFSTLWSATAIKPPTVFFLSELTDKGGLCEDNWEWVYKHTHGGTGSCMIKCPEIARVYADNPVLDMAYITSTGEPFSGTVLARSVIRRDNKTYIRAYQSDHKMGAVFTGYLQDKGFKENRDLLGVTIKKIFDPKNKSLLIMPYLDGSSQQVMTDSESADKFKVIRSLGVSGKDLRKIEYYSGTSGGRVNARPKCTHCESFGRSTDRGIIKEDGKQKKVDICEYCNYNFVFAENKRTRYSIDHFKFFWVIDYNGNQLYVLDKAKEEVPEEYKQITCKFTLQNESWKNNYSKFETKDGDRITDYNFVLTPNIAHASTPVKTYTGDVTDASVTRTFNSIVGFSSLSSELKQRLAYYSRHDRVANEMFNRVRYLDKKKSKLAFLKFMLDCKAITQEEFDANNEAVVIPETSVKLADGQSVVGRKYDADAGELVYTFSLSDEIKEKLWKPILSETEKLKKELDDLFAEWNAIEAVVL